MVGVHYDTFPPIKIDHAEAAAIFARSGREAASAAYRAALSTVRFLCKADKSVVAYYQMNLPIAFGMPGWPETIFILVIVVLLFGAKKLPELARGLGQSLGEFKKARDEFEREVRKSVGRT